MTNVKFYIESDNRVMAYFPNTVHNGIIMTCYSRIGQHSACHPDYVKGLKLANPAQYYDLLQELRGQGYDDLNILNTPRKPMHIKTARGLAANWHRGQNSALYSFASTGELSPDRAAEYITEVFEDLKKADPANHTGLNAFKELTRLYHFFMRHWLTVHGAK